ncbi:gliding motility-associated ABC transporter substrate-binding protein GldG [Cesiribacter sp. SM1]|uniref:gliding motility-associated ABC transporter substrate-binding protein GldG n=1 Tax=Cesiribacter sp. SM1 TaxID=2861196 RepID=UPI001CD7745B|nr:gliding motility-associated ABC transporter substrate-binding protein GldG [Cesiribacter sp. SM1]
MQIRKTQHSGTPKKIEDLLWFGIGLMLLLILNVWASDNFFRIDLTEDKRYSITPATTAVLEELEDVVYVDVYLEGDVPAGFKRLQRSVRETLDEFRTYAGGNIQYNFIDPSTAVSQNARNEFYSNLAAKGIQPTNIFDTEEGKRTEKLVFPGAVVSYGGQERGVMLLKGNMTATPEERLNQSVEGVEYELASAIRELTQQGKPQVGWLVGNGEADSIQVGSIMQTLQEQYDISRMRPEALAGQQPAAVVIANPTQQFTDQQRFLLDQYVMRGGNLLMFLDAVRVNMDSLGQGGTIAVPQPLGLEELLFRWGLRLNQNLVQDLSSGAYPIVVGNMGDQPQVRMLRWPFFPVMNNYAAHPIVRNLDATYARFVSSLDTVKAEGVRKTPLILTSQYSRLFNAPVRVSVEDLRRDVRPESYNAGPQPVAYLLEGEFTSLYKNRFLPEGVDEQGFVADSQGGKIVVVSDGDFPINEVNRRTREPLPLGAAPFTQQIFANSEFIQNALAYLTNESGLILARNKEIAIRPLDPVRVEAEKSWWQTLNLLVPVLLVVLLGVGHYFWRKRKYTRFAKPTEA